MFHLKNSRKIEHPKDGGAVLIITLVILLVIASLVSRDSLLTYKNNRLSRRLIAEYQAQLVAESLVRLAQERLVSGDIDALADTMQEEWAKPVTDESSYILTIEPCNARLDLNRTLDDQRIRDAAYQLLASAHAPDLAFDALMDWIDPDGTPRRPGLEGSEYQRSKVGYLPKNDRLETVEEALLVYGWEKIDKDWLRKNFTAWSGHNINLNFCSREAFAAYLPELLPYWNEVVRYRARQGFRMPEDLQQAIPILRNDLVLWKTVLDAISFKSQYFYATIEVWSPFIYEKQRCVLARNVLLPKSMPKVIRCDVLDIRPPAD